MCIRDSPVNGRRHLRGEEGLRHAAPQELVTSSRSSASKNPMDQDQIDDRGNEQPADRHSDNHGDAQALRSPGDVSEISLIWDEIKDGALPGARGMIVVCSLAYGIINVLIAR